IAELARREFGGEVGQVRDPLFSFVGTLSAPLGSAIPPTHSAFEPRFCSSYFALYGDPLLEPDLDPYPDGYLERLAAAGVDGIWLQAVLYRLAPFPWEPRLSARHQERQ